MKKFEAPELEVVTLAAEDIITGSACVSDDACPDITLGENETPPGPSL